MELPPRARRIHAAIKKHLEDPGTTSACAENTLRYQDGSSGCGNYLRVRGEYISFSKPTRMVRELPPRARRIRFLKKSFQAHDGTTSACAENTIAMARRVAITRNYLRVRGEYRGCVVGGQCAMELPPRARRILREKLRPIFYPGTTSACAENTATKPNT